MKRYFSAIICGVTMMFQAVGAEVEWLTDFEKAKAKAQEEKKIMMLNFTGSDWCGGCIMLDRDVFSKPEFKEYVAQNLVLVKVDFPLKKKLPPEQAKANDKLMSQFNIEVYPTLLYLDWNGKRLEKQEGYLRGGPAAFIKKTDKLIAKAKK